MSTERDFSSIFPIFIGLICLTILSFLRIRHFLFIYLWRRFSLFWNACFQSRHKYYPENQDETPNNRRRFEHGMWQVCRWTRNRTQNPSQAGGLSEAKVTAKNRNCIVSGWLTFLQPSYFDQRLQPRGVVETPLILIFPIEFFCEIIYGYVFGVKEWW